MTDRAVVSDAHGPQPQPRRLRFRLYLTPQRASMACAVLALINCVLIAGTWSFLSHYRDPAFDWRASPWTRYVLLQLDLAAANVAASWYASMLLLLVAVAAATCFALDRSYPPSSRRRVSAWGWLVVVLLFWIFSMEKMGAAHVRLAGLEDAFGLEATHVLRSMGVFSVILLGFVWVQARTIPWVLPLLILGLVGLLAWPLHEVSTERVVQIVRESSEWELREAVIVLHLAADLFTAVCFLAALGIYLTSREQAGVHERTMIVGSLRGVLWGCGILVGVFTVGAAVAAYRSPSEMAYNWYSSALCVLSAVPCLQIHAEPRRTPKGGRSVYLLTAVYAVFVSAYVGAIVYAYDHWGDYYPLEVFVHAALALTGLVIGVRLARRVESNPAKAAAVTWGIVTAAAFTVLRPWTAPLVFVAFAVLLISLPLHLDRRTTVD